MFINQRKIILHIYFVQGRGEGGLFSNEFPLPNRRPTVNLDRLDNDMRSGNSGVNYQLLLRFYV